MQLLSGKNIVLKIDKILASLGMNREILASNIGVTSSIFSHWLYRNSSPSIEILGKITEFLGITINDLVYNDCLDNETIEKHKILYEIKDLSQDQKETIITLLDKFSKDNKK